jgi:hypothetical protein
MNQNLLFIITFLNNQTKYYEDIEIYDFTNKSYDFNLINHNLKKRGINNIVVIKVSKDPLINRFIEFAPPYKGPIIKEITIPYNFFFTNKGIETFVLDQDLNYQHNYTKGFVVYLFENVTFSEIKSTLSQFICINEEYSLNTTFG